VICPIPMRLLISANGTYGFVSLGALQHSGLYHVDSEGCGPPHPGKNNFGKPGYNGPMPARRPWASISTIWIIGADARRTEGGGGGGGICQQA